MNERNVFGGVRTAGLSRGLRRLPEEVMQEFRVQRKQGLE